MGRRALFTRDEVFKAADELAAQGEDVTVRGLHAYLGGGSFSSVLKFFNEWKAARPAEERTTVEMPPALVASAETMWRLAVGEATKALAIEREKAARQVQEAETRVAETAELVDELQEQNTELNEKIAELSRSLEAKEAELRQALSDKSGLTAVNDELRQRVKAVEAEREGVRAERDSAIKDAAKLAGTVESQQKQIADLTNRLEEKPQKKG